MSCEGKTKKGLNCQKYAKKGKKFCSVHDPEKSTEKENIPKENIPKENIPKENIPKENIPKENIPKENIPKENIPKENIPKPEVKCSYENCNILTSASDGMCEIHSTTDPKCQSKTLRGTRCKRKTKDGKPGFCKQHTPEEKKDNNTKNNTKNNYSYNYSYSSTFDQNFWENIFKQFKSGGYGSYGFNYKPNNFNFNSNNNQAPPPLYTYSNPKDSLNFFGLPFTTDYSAIKKKYRELALIHHPDKGGNTEYFNKIQNHYDILTKNYKNKI